MKIVIKKAAIKGSLFLSYEFEQQDGNVNNLIKTSSDAPIHDDLRFSFRKLIPHFAFICEEVKDEKLVEKAFKNPDSYLGDVDTAPTDAFFKFRVFEFSIIEKDGDENIQFKGSKRLETNKEITFMTPSISLYDDEYKFVTQLQELIEEVKEEVLAYMQGKSAPKAQLEMFGEGEENENLDTD